jgi:hypothetical protein
MLEIYVYFFVFLNVAVDDIGQLHMVTILSIRIKPAVAIVEKTGWAPEPV